MDPNWKYVLPRSRSGSRSTLRNLHSDGSEVDTLKKSRSYEKVYRTHEPLEGKPNVEFPEKKWDLEEEDITSSEGGEYPNGKLAKDINYIATDGDGDGQPRQTGRRSERQQQQTPEQFAAPPVESPTSYSPTYSGFGQPSPNRQISGIRVLPTSSNQFFAEGAVSPVSAGSPTLTQNVGLPSPPLNNRSTEV